jgi:hypothetical protein
MEQEHMIIIALLVVALYFLMMRKPCACPIRPSQGFSERFENVGTEQVPVIGAGWIRNRRQDESGTIGIVNKESPTSHIRTRRETIPTGLDENVQGFHVRNRNHNMYQSQYVRHHLKADHRGKMMNSMIRGEGPDGAGMYA